jgi:hypothetical protein
MVQLVGERFDVEEFPRLFRTGDVHAIEEADGSVFLVGDTLEKFTDPRDVHAAADAALSKMFGVASLLVRNLRRPALSDGLQRERADGRRDITVLVSGVEALIKGGFIGFTIGNSPARSEPTEGERMLTVATQYPALDAALELWGNGTLTWPRLYRILEEVERGYLGAPVDRTGFCSDAQRGRFTRTANTSAGGVDSRHAGGRYEPPADPMTVDQAQAFIRSVLLGVLDGAIQPIAGPQSPPQSKE